MSFGDDIASREQLAPFFLYFLFVNHLVRIDFESLADGLLFDLVGFPRLELAFALSLEDVLQIIVGLSSTFTIGQAYE